MTTAPPLLLIPGLNCSARLFAPQMSALWCRRPVMVADHSTADSIEDLAEHILAAAPPRFALAGFSMGGFIALEILRRSPERVERLALLSTSAAPERPDQAIASTRRERIAMARSGRFDEIAPLHFARNVHPSRQGDEALRALHRRMTQEVGPQAYIRQQTAIGRRPDARPSLNRIGCPTLVLVGDADQLTPPAQAEELHADITGSRLLVVEKCGHLAPLERPEAVGNALEQWLDG
jgi:pimeloyl-ACP methyl ester carboxylesterase